MAESALVCQRCGNLRSVCSDPARDWHPQESVCYSTATVEWGTRRLRAEHKDFNTESRDERGELLMSPLEGVSVWASDIDFEAMRESVEGEVGQSG